MTYPIINWQKPGCWFHNFNKEKTFKHKHDIIKLKTNDQVELEHFTITITKLFTRKNGVQEGHFVFSTNQKGESNET